MPDKLTLITDLQSLSHNDAIAFINDLPFAYYRADLDGHVLAASAKAVQMFGYDRVEDIINVNLTDYYVAPDGRNKFMAALGEGKGVIENYEAEMRGPKGNFWLATTAKIVYDAQQIPIAVEGLAQDVTERRKIFENPGQGTLFFEAFASAADLGVGITSVNGEVIFANAQMLELMGLAKIELEMSNILAAMEPNLRKVAEASIETVLNGGSVHQQEVLIAAEGKKVWRGFSMFLMEHPTFKESYICTIIQDISARKAQESQLIQSSKLASIGELAAGIAHEINQPLNVIRLAAVNLRNYLTKTSVLDDKTEDSLVRINTQIGRAANIVRQLLLYGREADDTENYCDPSVALENSAQMIQQTLKVENISLTINDLPEPVTLCCNLTKFEQVVMNLIGNAKDSILDRRRTDDNSALMGNITIALHREVDHLEIKVTDNGMGIPDHLRDSIMEPFVTTKKVGSGTGLGLSVSQGIITAAGGTLQFLDVSDGACAQIILPLSTES
ncbi:PAS domain S-box protein [Luminiphilus sp.]|nr:PAS domain S-box protein [Luminiphilus sp.]